MSPDPVTSALADSSAAQYAAWLSVAVVGALAIGLVGGALLLVRMVTRIGDRIVAPEQRLTTYECGEAPVGSPWFRFNNRFTTVALTFLVFDVELALLWPILPHGLTWIASGRAHEVFAEIAAFAGMLALGLFWVSRSGGFAWDRTIDTSTLTTPPSTTGSTPSKETDVGSR